MPAYFDITFEFIKGPTAMKDAYNALINSGLKFKSGCYEAENDTFEDIVKWNQDKLNENFVLGDTENSSNDYRQILFDYLEFSEVRVYVMNEKKSSTFALVLIVKENELGDYIEEESSDGKRNYIWKQKVEIMNQLIQLSRKMWEYSSALTIQTGWEMSDIPPKYIDLDATHSAQAEPFAIISSSKYYSQWGLKATNIERDGVLLENKKSKNDWTNVVTI